MPLTGLDKQQIKFSGDASLLVSSSLRANFQENNNGYPFLYLLPLPESCCWFLEVIYYGIYASCKVAIDYLSL